MPIPAIESPPWPHRAPDPQPPGDRRVFNETELAQRWGISVKTLQRWRSEGGGPRYLKLSRRVSYPLDSVIAFERFSLRESTGERAAG